MSEGTLSAGSVSLGIKANAKGFGRDLESQVAEQEGLFAGLGRNLGGSILKGLGALGIAFEIGEIVKSGIEEYSAWDSMNAQFAAGLKSTGNAAGLTVKGMDDLASSIAAYSGQSEASIGKTEQVLQTFTNIRNVGPDKIFNDATTAAANMAAKLGGDASASAIQLGKALNDPVKGMTALRRVGVSFTAAQQDQVKAMVAAGNTLGAQKVILGELNHEFGGAAEAAGKTFPGEINRAKVAVGELNRSIVGAILPILTPIIGGLATGIGKVALASEGLSDKLHERLEPVLHTVSEAFKLVLGAITGAGADVDLGKWTNPLIDFGAAVSRVLTASRGIISAFWSALQPVLRSVGGAFMALLPSITQLLPTIIGFASAFSPIQLIFRALAPVLPQIVGLLGGLAATLAGVLVKALAALLPVIQQVATILVGQLSAVFVRLVPVVALLATTVGTVLGTVLRAVVPLIQLLATFLGTLLTAVAPLIPVVLRLVSSIAPLLVQLVQLAGQILQPVIQLLTVLLKPVLALATGIISVLVPVLTIIINILAVVLTGAIKAVGAIFTWLWNSIVHPLITLIVAEFKAWSAIVTWLWTNIISPYFKLVGAEFTWIYNSIIKPIVALIVAQVHAWASVITWVWNNAISPALHGIGSLFSWLWSNVISPTIRNITNAVHTVGSVFGTVFGAIGDVVRGAFNGVVDFIRGQMNGIIDVVNGAIGGINAIAGTVGKALGVNIHLGTIPHLATGGDVVKAGYALVGENGPEVLKLPAGATVYPNSGGRSPAPAGMQLVYNAAPNQSFDAETDFKLAWKRMSALRANTIG